MNIKNKENPILISKNGHSLIDLIFEPIITERTTILRDKSLSNKDEKKNKELCCFWVHRSLEKPEIKKTIEFVFNVKVESVNTYNKGQKGETKHDRTKLRRKVGPGLKKKAFITLKPGFSLDLNKI